MSFYQKVIVIVNSENKARPGVRYIDVRPEFAGQRIDNFLLAQLKGVPRTLIYRILRKGEVRVNRGRIAPSYRLCENDKVRIPPVSQPTAKELALPSTRLSDQIAAAIIYEDDDMLVMNKPSGIAVHGGSGVSLGVIEALRAMRPESKQLELVHRLDRETSGCLLIAKKRSALKILHELMREQKIKKTYVTLVQGRWSPDQHTIEWALVKNQLQSGERMVRVARDGKPAITRFRPLRYLRDSTLLSAELVTGRTHQIRVHAAHAEHPIAGDEKYGDRDFNKAMRQQGLKRLFLHAAEITLPLPATQVQHTFSAPLEDELNGLIMLLEQS